MSECEIKPMSCCSMLATKTMYFRPDERPGRVHQSETLDYWCLKNQKPVGPDGIDVCPVKCQPGRKCYADEE